MTSEVDLFAPKPGFLEERWIVQLRPQAMRSSRLLMFLSWLRIQILQVLEYVRLPVQVELHFMTWCFRSFRVSSFPWKQNLFTMKTEPARNE